MASGSINDPKHWEGRAEEMRVLAEQMTDDTAKQMMLKLANDYDRLAEHAAHRARDQNAAVSTVPRAR